MISKTTKHARRARRKKFAATVALMATASLTQQVAANAATEPSVTAAATSGFATSTQNFGMTYVGTNNGTGIVVTIENGEFVIDDDDPITAGPGCKPVVGDVSKVTCTVVKIGAFFKEFQVEGKGGNDRIENRTQISPNSREGVQMKAVGGTGDDTLLGADVTIDTLLGGDDNDLLAGRSGNDFLSGGSGTDRLRGNDGRDELRGGAGIDSLNGGAGDDKLDGGLDGDIIDGGIDADLVTYEGRPEPLTIDLTSKRPSGAVGENDQLSRVEHVIGGDSDDNIIGNADNNVLRGLRGNDTIFGNAGADALLGDEGFDFLNTNNSSGLSAVEAELKDGSVDEAKGGADNDICLRSVTDGDVVECEDVLP
jgi:Ca2+-binding RTX toxin-like protein